MLAQSTRFSEREREFEFCCGEILYNGSVLWVTVVIMMMRKKEAFFWLRRLPILPFCNNWSTLSMTMTMTMTMTMSFSFTFICAECAPLPLCFLFLDSLSASISAHLFFSDNPYLPL